MSCARPISNTYQQHPATSESFRRLIASLRSNPIRRHKNSESACTFSMSDVSISESLQESERAIKAGSTGSVSFAYRCTQTVHLPNSLAAASSMARLAERISVERTCTEGSFCLTGSHAMSSAGRRWWRVASAMISKRVRSHRYWQY